MDYSNPNMSGNGESLAYVGRELAPVEELCSRMTTSKLDSVASSSSALPDDLSYQYWSSCCLNYDGKICDGFYEITGEFPDAVTSPDDFPLLSALQEVRVNPNLKREVILFDARTDPELRSIIAEAQAALQQAGCGAERDRLVCHRNLAQVVAGRLGGPLPTLADAAAHASKCIDELQARLGTVVTPIGQIVVGTARHRVLLYKYLADIFGLKVRLIKGRFYTESEDGARAVIELSGQEHQLDLVVRPGVAQPLEQKLALRASSREVAGTDVFSRASSVGGSTTGTAPASRTPSDAAQAEAIQAVAAAALAVGLGGSPRSPSISGSPPRPAAAPAAIPTLEQAMQMAAAAALGGGVPSGLSPFVSGPPSPLQTRAHAAPGGQHDSSNAAGMRFSFGGGHNCNDEMPHAGRSMSPSPYENAGAPYSWQGYHEGFGSPMPGHSMCSSITTPPRLSSEQLPIPHPIRSSRDLGSASDLFELGPPALISDASGQQYLVQPVRASLDLSVHTLQQSIPSSYDGSAQYSRSSGDGPSLNASLPLPWAPSNPIDPAPSGSRPLTPTAEDVGLARTTTSTTSGASQQLPQPYSYQYNPQQPPRVSSAAALPDMGGYFTAPRTSWNGPEVMMQWAALQAAASASANANADANARQSLDLPNRQSLDHQTSYAESIDVKRLYLDGLRNTGTQLSVRMSVPVEWEQRQALLSRQEDSGPFDLRRNSPPAAEKKAASHSSGNGVPFPVADLSTSTSHSSDGAGGGTMFSPFGNVTSPLTGSSPASSLGTSKSQQLETVASGMAGLAEPSNATRNQGGTQTPTSPAPKSTGAMSHEIGADMKPVPSLSPSTLSTLISGGMSLASHDSGDDDGWEIDKDEIVLGPRIGIGSFGEVFRAQWRETEVAVKVFLDQEFGVRMLESFRKEVSIMKKLRHPNIVQFMGACTKAPFLCIVTQYVSRGSLFKLLHRPAPNGPVLDNRRRLQMALDVCRGMNYLHTCRPPVIHRDLKSPNLLVDKDLTIKVCDFGLSRVRHTTVLSTKSQAGTPEWTAPEVLQGKSCNEASDVYSFGVILWELLSGEEPWSDKSAMQVVGAVGFAGQRLAVPEGTSPALSDLMERCFGEPDDRPSFSEIISILRRQISALAAANSAHSGLLSSSRPAQQRI